MKSYKFWLLVSCFAIVDMAYVGRLPAKQLNTKRIENLLKIYLLPLLQRHGQMICCRALWKTGKDDLELAKKLITNKRKHLDAAINLLVPKPVCFVSAIGGVSLNKKKKDKQQPKQKNKSSQDQCAEDEVVSEEDESDDFATIYPCVSYCIVVPGDSDVEGERRKITKLLHEAEVEVDVTGIVCKDRRPQHEGPRQLSIVFKDINNGWTQDMVVTSSRFCYRQLIEGRLQESVYDYSLDVPAAQIESIAKIHLNHPELAESFEKILPKLKSDGLEVEVLMNERALSQPEVTSTPANWQFGETLEKIYFAMQTLDHKLYKGDVYCKPQDSQNTYLFLADVESYLHMLAGNPLLKKDIVDNIVHLCRILGHHECQQMPQLKFDYDLIEVKPPGKCFSISRRRFIDYPYKGEKPSPRAVKDYDSQCPPEPRYFKEGVENSFDEDSVKINFLNKFYQCLTVGLMPHKCKRLVVEGPRDSGKTSWANVLLGVIPIKHIASITKEKQFSAAMMTEETQLVVMDEWSDATLQSDMAKSVLQGGLMLTAVKHGKPRLLHNHCPFYITTNKVPYFGEEDDENVKRRIESFQTKSLPNTVHNADTWMSEHCMHCVAWMADEINSNIELVNAKERWYEEDQLPTSSLQSAPTQVNSSECLERMLTLSKTDLTDNAAFAPYVPPYDPNDYWEDDALRSAEADANDRYHVRCEDRNLRLAVNSVRPSDGESDDDLEDFSSVPYARAVLMAMLEVTPSCALKPEDDLVFEVRRVEIDPTPDPAFDAWLLRHGHSRKEFSTERFLERYPRARRYVGSNEPPEKFHGAEQGNPYLISQKYSRAEESEEVVEEPAEYQGQGQQETSGSDFQDSGDIQPGQDMPRASGYNRAVEINVEEAAEREDQEQQRGEEEPRASEKRCQQEQREQPGWKTKFGKFWEKMPF